jgi:hypothetical protein
MNKPRVLVGDDNVNNPHHIGHTKLSDFRNVAADLDFTDDPNRFIEMARTRQYDTLIVDLIWEKDDYGRDCPRGYRLLDAVRDCAPKRILWNPTNEDTGNLGFKYGATHWIPAGIRPKDLEKVLRKETFEVINKEQGTELLIKAEGYDDTTFSLPIDGEYVSAIMYADRSGPGLIYVGTSICCAAHLYELSLHDDSEGGLAVKTRKVLAVDFNVYDIIPGEDNNGGPLSELLVTGAGCSGNGVRHIDLLNHRISSLVPSLNEQHWLGGDDCSERVFKLQPGAIKGDKVNILIHQGMQAHEMWKFRREDWKAIYGLRCERRAVKIGLDEKLKSLDLDPERIASSSKGMVRKDVYDIKAAHISIGFRKES